MAEAEKTSTLSNVTGVTFKNPNPQSAKGEDAAMSDLYGRSLATISKPGQPQVQASFNVENAFSGKAGEAGTFVSDRKRDRPSFFENVADAFSEWRAMTVASLIRRNIIEEKTSPEKTKTTETVHAILSEPAIQDVPTISTLKEETIEEKPKEVSRTHSALKGSTTMFDVAKTTHKTTPVTVSPSSFQKTRSREVQKVRTFKSDAALLQPDVATESPDITTALMHEPEPTAPEPKFEPEAAHVATLDMRSSMIAPDVHTHIDGTDIVASEIKKSGLLEEAHAIPVPPVIEKMVAPQAAVQPASRVAVPVPETTSAWTHVLDTETHFEDAPLSEIKPLPPLPQNDVPPVFSGNTPAAFAELRAFDTLPPTSPLPHKDRSARVEETIKRIQSHTNKIETPVPRTVAQNESAIPFVDRPLSELGDTVKPHEEPSLSIEPTPIDIASTPMESEDKPSFHTRAALVRTSDVQKEDVSPSYTPRPVSTPAPIRTIETAVPARFALRIVLILCVAGTIMVSGAYLFTRVKPEIGTTPVRTDPAPIVSEENPNQLILNANSETFLGDIQRAVTEAPPGLTELTIYTNEPPRVATTQEFFAQLDTAMLPRTVRALEPVFMIGSITTTRNEPFIRIRSNNFDALFAGLLEWESTMQQELAPLFGNPRTETTSFTDAVRNNKSIRILRDASGNEVMLYSFIDNRTVVITSSGEALAKLVEQF